MDPPPGAAGPNSRRLEDPPLIVGEGRFVADLVTPETLHCVFVRSPFAHGDVIGVETEEAAAVLGVMGIFSAKDLALPDIPSVTGRGPEAPHMTRPVLAGRRVRHVGEPISVVVAESAVAAADAADLVWIDIEPREPVLDAEQAARSNNHLFEGGNNVVARLTLAVGPVQEGPPPLRTVTTALSPRLAPVPIETLGIVADGAQQQLRVWCSHQAPHRLQNQLSKLLSIDPTDLRVTVPDVGGAFGMKGMLYPEYLVVTHLARRLGRRVAWIQSRREQFASGTHGRAQRHTVTIEGDGTGRIHRLHIDNLSDTGAYPHNGSQIPLFTRLVASGLYDIPRVEVDTTIVVTNRAPTGSYRGAGRPEATLAIERAIDAFARAGDLDPVEVRLQNVVSHLPHTTPTGAVYDSGDYAAAIRRTVELLDLPALREEQARRHRAGHDPIGVGLGAFVERAGGAVDSSEYAQVEVTSREIVVRTGSCDTGQGHTTALTRVARGVFGDVPVTVLAKDTDLVAAGTGTFASRSTQIGAAAVQRMAKAVLDEALNRAAARLEAASTDVEYCDGGFQVVGVPGTRIGLFDLVDDGLASEENFVPGAQTFPYGVHAAVVEVRLETGEVEVRRLVTVDDCGTVLDERLVEGQLHGSAAQGVGQALFEEMRYDEAGQPITASLMDYVIPHAADVIEPEADHLVHPAPSNPLGAKGAGEAGSIGVPAAILNAAVDALAPHGVTNLQLPLTPHRVWDAIRQARAGLAAQGPDS